MGNVVASSALREGMEVDTYALLNAAIPAMCHDSRASLYDNVETTPDGDSDPLTSALGFADKSIQTNGAELINFFLTNDSALDRWTDNNDILKPDNIVGAGYYFEPNNNPGTKLGISFATQIGRHVRTVHEALAHVTKSRTFTVGAKGATQGSISSSVDLGAEFGFGTTHSAEWVEDYLDTRAFYVRLLQEYGLDLIE